MPRSISVTRWQAPGRSHGSIRSIKRSSPSSSTISSPAPSKGERQIEAWARFLRTVAERIFERAAAAVPIAGARRLKAIAVAEEKLGGLFWRSFKGYLVKPEQEAADVG